MKGLPQEVVMECLALREQRSNIDLVADVTESQLQKVCAYLCTLYMYSTCTCTCTVYFTVVWPKSTCTCMCMYVHILHT